MHSKKNLLKTFKESIISIKQKQKKNLIKRKWMNFW